MQKVPRTISATKVQRKQWQLQGIRGGRGIRIWCGGGRLKSSGMGKREKLESLMALKEIKKRALFLVEECTSSNSELQEYQVNSAPLA